MLHKTAFRKLGWFLVLLVGGVLFSCQKVADEMVDIHELAAPERIVEVDASAATHEVQVYANERFSAEIDGDAASWARLDRHTFAKDCMLRVEVDANEGLRRQASILLTSESGLRDTIRLRQQGDVELLSVAEQYQTVMGSRDSRHDLRLTTNVDTESLVCEILHPAEEPEWVEGVEFDDKGACIVKCKANPDADKMRRCDIVISFVSAWEEKMEVKVCLTQKSASDMLGREISFAEARNEDGSLAMSNGRYEGDYVIEGIVVSDCTSENMAANPNISHNNINRTHNARTVYIEESAEDGGGLRLWLATGVENTFKRGTHLHINLRGTTLSTSDENGGCSILNLAMSNIVESESNVEIPVRERTIASLTDNDLYTYCTITDVEFLFKQGAYTNVLETYFPKASSLTEGVKNVHSAIDSATRLLTDKANNALYMQINAECPWRRTLNPSSEGNHGVPQGVGSVSGIIVPGENVRYGGRIGNYSIRPLNHDDIDIAWEAGSSLTTLAEWVFDHKVTYSDIYKAHNANNPYLWEGEFVEKSASAVNRMYATGGEQQTATFYCNNLSTLKDLVYKDMYYQLRDTRPMFADGFDSKYVWDGDDWGVTFSGHWRDTNDCMGSYRSDGKGVYHRCGRTAYGNYVWGTNLSGWWDWNADGESYKATTGFIFSLSTAGISKPLCISFTMGAGGAPATTWGQYYNYNDGFMNSMNGYYSQNYPLYWKVQYSTDMGATWLDGAVNAASGESQFKLMPTPWWSTGVYPDPTSDELVGTAYVNAEVAPGLVEYKYKLPAEASGQSRLLVRITPASTTVATLLPSQGNFSQPLDQGVQATKSANFGNMIRFGGMKIQY